MAGLNFIPPPLKTQIIDPESGELTKVWIDWFYRLNRALSDFEIFTESDDSTALLGSFLQAVEQVEALARSFEGSFVPPNYLGRVTIERGLSIGISRHTTTKTIDDTSFNWFGNTDAGGFTFTLPAGVQSRGYRIINSSTSGNALGLAPNGAENLFGSNDSISLADGEAVIIFYDDNDGWW